MTKRGESPSVLKTILTIIGIISGLLSLLFFAFLLYAVVSAAGGPAGSGNVAVIPVKGVIVQEADSGTFAEASVTSRQITDWIADAEADPSIKAVIFDIDSPGGTPVASEEIASAIATMEKPSVALVHEIGASGAYWVASATDRIFASRMSLVGSIGVLASYIEFAGTLERYNATYRSITAGEFKDTGSPFKHLSPDEEKMFRAQLAKMHDYFIQSVAQNRGLPEDKVRKLATGWVFLGSEALDNGLIDQIGNEHDVVKYLEDDLGEPVELVEYHAPLGFVQQVLGVLKDASFEMGKGIGVALTTPRVESVPRVVT
ncbi:MAG TPA: signal peptide peptidase SppA [Candidatus Binatia bacterium]|nr:signal peptide peptidase SppA [Candidatus Binatia bacterium]